MGRPLNHPLDRDGEFQERFRSLSAEDRSFYYELQMYLNGCDRQTARALYPLIAEEGDAGRISRICLRLEELRLGNDRGADVPESGDNVRRLDSLMEPAHAFDPDENRLHNRFRWLPPEDAARFLALSRHLFPGADLPAVSDFLELLLQDRAALRDFAAMPKSLRQGILEDLMQRVLEDGLDLGSAVQDLQRALHSRKKQP